MSGKGSVFKVPAASFEWAMRRCEELLTPQGTAIAKWDVRRLMVAAYAQGCQDTLGSLELRGVDLSPIEREPHGGGRP